MDSRNKSDIVEARKPFEEPSISAPLELGDAAKAGPLMALASGSGGGPGLDMGGFPPDSIGLDGAADGGAGGGIAVDGGGGDT